MLKVNRTACACANVLNFSQFFAFNQLYILNIGIKCNYVHNILAGDC